MPENNGQVHETQDAADVIAARYGLPEDHEAVTSIASLEAENEDLRVRLAAAEAKLEASRYDGMTGLLRRDAFLESMEEKRAAVHLNRNEDHGHDTGFLIMLDLKKLHSINNKKGGQSAGDKVITDTGEGLAGIFDPSEDINATAGRLGGDEFAVFTTFDSAQYSLEYITQSMFTRLNKLATQHTPFGLNVGDAAVSSPEKSFIDMLREADPKAPKTRAQRIGKFALNLSYAIRRQLPAR